MRLCGQSQYGGECKAVCVPRSWTHETQDGLLRSLTQGFFSSRVKLLFSEVVAVTRYSVKVGDRWIAASYGSAGPGILLTNQREDAGSWVSHEKAAQVARLASQFFKETAWIHVAEEADYPPSWNAHKSACA